MAWRGSGVRVPSAPPSITAGRPAFPSLALVEVRLLVRQAFRRPDVQRLAGDGVTGDLLEERLAFQRQDGCRRLRHHRCRLLVVSKERDLPEVVATAERGNRSVVADDLHLAVLDHVEMMSGLSLPHNGGTGCCRDLRHASGEPLEFGSGKCGEQVHRTEQPEFAIGSRLRAIVEAADPAPEEEDRRRQQEPGYEDSTPYT